MFSFFGNDSKLRVDYEKKTEELRLEKLRVEQLEQTCEELVYSLNIEKSVEQELKEQLAERDIQLQKEIEKVVRLEIVLKEEMEKKEIVRDNVVIHLIEQKNKQESLLDQINKLKKQVTERDIQLVELRTNYETKIEQTKYPITKKLEQMFISWTTDYKHFGAKHISDQQFIRIKDKIREYTHLFENIKGLFHVSYITVSDPSPYGYINTNAIHTYLITLNGLYQLKFCYNPHIETSFGDMFLSSILSSLELPFELKWDKIKEIERVDWDTLDRFLNKSNGHLGNHNLGGIDYFNIISSKIKDFLFAILGV